MSFMFLRVLAEIFKIGNMKIYEELKIKKSSDYKFGQQLIFPYKRIIGNTATRTLPENLVN